MRVGPWPRRRLATGLLGFLLLCLALGTGVRGGCDSTCADQADCYCDQVCGLWGDCCESTASKELVCPTTLGSGELNVSSVIPTAATYYSFDEWVAVLEPGGLTPRAASACAKALTSCKGRGCYGAECALPCVFEAAASKAAEGCNTPKLDVLDYEFCKTPSTTTLQCSDLPEVCCAALSNIRYGAICGDAQVGCLCDGKGGGVQLIARGDVTQTGSSGCITGCVQYDTYYVAAATAAAPLCSDLLSGLSLSRRLEIANAANLRGEERRLQTTTSPDGASLTVFDDQLTIKCETPLASFGDVDPTLPLAVNVTTSNEATQAIVAGTDNSGHEITQPVSLVKGACVIISSNDVVPLTVTPAGWGKSSAAAINAMIVAVIVAIIAAAVVASQTGSGQMSGAAVSLGLSAVMSAQTITILALIDTGVNDPNSVAFAQMGSAIQWTQLWVDTGAAGSCSGPNGLNAGTFLGNSIIILLLLPLLLLVHLLVVSAVEAHWLAKDHLMHRRRGESAVWVNSAPDGEYLDDLDASEGHSPELQQQEQAPEEQRLTSAFRSGGSIGGGGGGGGSGGNPNEAPGALSASGNGNGNRASMSRVGGMMSAFGGSKGSRTAPRAASGPIVVRRRASSVASMGAISNLSGEARDSQRFSQGALGAMPSSRPRAPEFHPDLDDPVDHIKARSESAWVHFPHVELMFLVIAFTGGALAQVSALTSSCWWIRLMGTLMWTILPLCLLIMTCMFMVANVLGPGRRLRFVYDDLPNGGRPQPSGGPLRAVSTFSVRRIMPSNTGDDLDEEEDSAERDAESAERDANAAFGNGKEVSKTGNRMHGRTQSGGFSMGSARQMSVATAVDGWRKGWSGEEPSILTWADRGHWEERHEDLSHKSVRIGFEPLYVDFYGEWAVLYFVFVLLKLMSVAVVLAVSSDGLVSTAALFALYGTDFLVQVIFRPYNNVVVGIISLVVTSLDIICLVLLALVSAGISASAPCFQACMLLQLLGITVISVPIYLDTISMMKFWHAHRDDDLEEDEEDDEDEEDAAAANGGGSTSGRSSNSGRSKSSGRSSSGSGSVGSRASSRNRRGQARIEPSVAENSDEEDTAAESKEAADGAGAGAANDADNDPTMRAGGLRRVATGESGGGGGAMVDSRGSVGGGMGLPQSASRGLLADREHRAHWKAYWGHLVYWNLRDAGAAIKTGITRDPAVASGDDEGSRWRPIRFGRKKFRRERFKIGPKFATDNDDDSSVYSAGVDAHVPARRSVKFDPAVVRSIRSISGRGSVKRGGSGSLGGFDAADEQKKDAEAVPVAFRAHQEHVYGEERSQPVPEGKEELEERGEGVTAGEGSRAAFF